MCLCVKVGKLVMELDTCYRWSEQQLSRSQQEGSGRSLDTTQHAELTKDAKKLPEFRVRCGECVCVCACVYVFVCVCVMCVGGDEPPCPPLQRVEIFGQCQMILQKCEDLLKKSSAAVHRDIQKLYAGLANIWTMAAKCKQLTQVRSPSPSSPSPHSLLPPPSPTSYLPP